MSLLYKVLCGVHEIVPVGEKNVKKSVYFAFSGYFGDNKYMYLQKHI